MLTIRIPRPLGTTQMMYEYHKTGDASLLENIQHLLIQQWLINNGQLCGRSLSADKLCEFLRCDPSIIRLQMRDSLLVNSKIWDKDKQEELMNALIGQQLMWAMEDRMDASQQLEVLKRSQGDKYTPFVTSEVNRVLGLKQTSLNGLGQIFRSMSGGGSINIFNKVENNNTQASIGIDEALQLIREENRRLPVTKEMEGSLYPHELSYIEATKDFSALPEVQADKQIGIDSSKEGLDLKNDALKAIVDDYKGAIEESDETHHTIRREIELKIDRTAYDPELNIYPV